jgi:hypothetical protein
MDLAFAKAPAEQHSNPTELHMENIERPIDEKRERNEDRDGRTARPDDIERSAGRRERDDDEKDRDSSPRGDRDVDESDVDDINDVDDTESETR